MKDYIKIKFREEVYGSLRAPTNLATLCNIFKLSGRSCPTLISIAKNSREDPIVITQMDQTIESGFYELLSRRDVEFDPSIDVFPALPTIQKKTKFSRIEGPNELKAIKTQSNPEEFTFPIPEDEMNTAIRAMLHVIGSIPPRYLKCNVILSNQVDRAISDVQRIQSTMSQLYAQQDQSEYYKIVSSKRRVPLSVGIHLTFIQYRIFNILYDTWRKVWVRASPITRYFKVSDVKTLESIELSEHYLNRLNSWRRILEMDTWEQLEKTIELENMHKKKEYISDAEKLFRPDKLKSDQHPRVWTYLAQPADSISIDLSNTKNEKSGKIIDAEETLKDFRKMYIDNLVKHDVTDDQEMNYLLIKMVNMDKLFKTHTDSDDKSDEKPVYPSKFIKNRIRKEFRIKDT